METQSTIVHGSGITDTYHDFGNLTNRDAIELAIANGCHRPVTNLEHDGIEPTFIGVIRHNVLWQWLVREASLLLERKKYVFPLSERQTQMVQVLVDDLINGKDAVPEELYKESSRADLEVLPDTYVRDKVVRGLARDDAYKITKAVWKRFDEYKKPGDPSYNSALFSQILFRITDAMIISTKPETIETNGTQPSLAAFKEAFLSLHDSIDGKIEDAVPIACYMGNTLYETEAQDKIREVVLEWMKKLPTGPLYEEEILRQVRSISDLRIYAVFRAAEQATNDPLLQSFQNFVLNEMTERSKSRGRGR